MKKLLLVLIIILFNSCATILSGTRERILVNSNKVGDIFINGDLIGNTTKPFTINKIIIKKNLVLKVDGFQDKRIELKRKFNSLSLIGALFPISLAIDIITGAILNFDRNNYLIEYSDLDYIKSGLSICGKDIDKVNLYDLREMVKIFICDCEENGIIFKENEVMITSEILDSGTVAISKGMYNDNQIQIQVDAQQWKDATPSKKWYILYHELGHDLLNLEHGNGGEMMYNYEKPDYSWNEWIEAKDYMLMSYKNNKQSNPKTVFKGFKKGLNTIGIIDLGLTKSELIKMEFNQLVEITKKEQHTKMGISQLAEFIFCTFISQIIFLFPLILIITGLIYVFE